MIVITLIACSQTDQASLETGEDAGPPEATVVPGEVLVTEVMFDPGMVDGDLGEWVEIQNLTAGEIDLAGVVVQDDDATGFVIDKPLPVAAGGFVVLGPSGDAAANGGAPVDYVYAVDAVKLGNEGDALTLLANGDTLDTFTWDATVFTVAEGSALQLGQGVTDPNANDAAAAWCLATTPYGAGDLGSPGQANGTCGSSP